MQNSKRWTGMMLLILAALLLAACGGDSTNSEAKVEPATVEEIEGSELNRVTLTERAAQRLDIQTASIREERVGGAALKVIPYSAVIYGLRGETWAYISPEPLLFIREPITIDYIEGDMAYLVDGPATGTLVATVGVAELYGIDTGVGK